MEQYIKTVLGCQIQSKDYKLPPQMPQYLLNDYSYQKYVIDGQECLFITPYAFSLSAYKKQYPKIRQITNHHVVLHMNVITPYQKKVMIDERIPFVIDHSQIYLPFLAMSLTEKYREETEARRFSPITQLVFLYLLYNKQKLTVTDLAPRINCSTMSVTRAYKALVDCGLFVSEQDGVKKYIIPKSDEGELLRNAEQFFINPVEKTIYMSKGSGLSEYLASGIYALSKKTMLAANEYDLCFAIYQKAQSGVRDTVPKSAFLEGTAVAVEKWRYDPSPLAEDDTVDDISLILSMNESKDERVQMELDRLRRKYQW